MANRNGVAGKRTATEVDSTTPDTFRPGQIVSEAAAFCHLGLSTTRGAPPVRASPCGRGKQRFVISVLEIVIPSHTQPCSDPHAVAAEEGTIAEASEHHHVSKRAKVQAPSEAKGVPQAPGSAALSLGQAQTAQVAQAETRYRTRATRHPLIGKTVEVLFRMIDGSVQSFEGHIVMVEPSGPKPVKVKFSGYGEESYSIEQAYASLVPEVCATPPKASKKRAAPAGANTTTSKAAKKPKTSAHARQVPCESKGYPRDGRARNAPYQHTA